MKFYKVGPLKCKIFLSPSNVFLFSRVPKAAFRPTPSAFPPLNQLTFNKKKKKKKRRKKKEEEVVAAAKMSLFFEKAQVSPVAAGEKKKILS